MSVVLSGVLIGDKKVEVNHEPSGVRIITSAPIDNNGDGSSFSPTDLLAASLGSCVLTIMGIAAEKNGFSIDGARFRCEKHMTEEPRHIGRVELWLTLPDSLDQHARALLEKVSSACPVHRSLDKDVEVSVTFEYATLSIQ